MAVQRSHQRCGVRDHHVCIESPEHPKRLFPCDPGLLIGPWRAPLAVAPLAQHFRHHRHAQPLLLQPKAQCLGQLCLASAFCAEQGDASRAGHGGQVHGGSSSELALPRAPADHAQRREQRIEQCREPQTFPGKQAHADHVDRKPYGPVFDVLSAPAGTGQRCSPRWGKHPTTAHRCRYRSSGTAPWPARARRSWRGSTAERDRVRRLMASALPSSRRPRSHCPHPHRATSAKNTCSAASPYSLFCQNRATYRTELIAANGQPQWISRMLQPTMASATTTATISSQVVGEPQTVNASRKRSSATGTRPAPGRPKRACAPPRGSDDTQCAAWGHHFEICT
jgi:hypothetical protein